MDAATHTRGKRALRRLRAAGPPVLVGLVLVGAVASILHQSPPGLGGSGLDNLLNNWVYNAVLGLASVACLWRALAVRRDRMAWACIGLSLGLWAAADIYWTVAIADLAEQPYPSLADALWIASYAPYYVGLLLFVRGRVTHVHASTWLDGAIGGLAMAALAAAFLAPALVGLTTGDVATVATNLAYPLADILLLLFLVGAITVVGLRGGVEWPLIGLGLLTLAAADSIYLVQVAQGTYVEGKALDGLWLVNGAVLAIAAWVSTRGRPAERRTYHSLTLPTLFGSLAVGILIYDLFDPIGRLGEALAIAALGAMVIRLLLSFGENARLLKAVRSESITDDLTGLGNRRHLLGDLERALAQDGSSPLCLFALFDLDGFKNYNDSFGHAAGDVLLRRLGEKLKLAVGPDGGAYRLGGDEFCVILPGNDRREEVLAEAAIALSEVGEGFAIGSSYGAVEVPAETTDPSEALRLADSRMYARKRGRRLSAERQTRDVLISAQLEREPEISPHLKGVARHAAEVGRSLGMDGEELEVLIRAAELHDIGKIAIPQEVLRTPGELDEAGWRLIHQHTMIGERILNSAPAMVPVSKLVRSTHERWDGTGYPDGLREEEIGLGSRIIFACDAFDAMRSDRPYAKPMSVEDSVAELQRNAGTQFDPRVVRVLCEVVSVESTSPSIAAKGAPVGSEAG